MMDSALTDATVALRSSPDVRTLKVGVVSRTCVSRRGELVGVRMIVSRSLVSRLGELVGVRMTCLLRVDFSDVGVLLCDSVRWMSARRCLTTERWSRLRIEGLCGRLAGGGERKPDLVGVLWGVEGLGTGGSYSS